MRIEWLPEVARNLTTQLEWIAERDPWTAIGTGDAVHAAITRLAEHPAPGRPGHAPTARDPVGVGWPYLLLHRTEPTALVALRILHGAQRWPPA